jgi:hypothetical protein
LQLSGEDLCALLIDVIVVGKLLEDPMTVLADLDLHRKGAAQRAALVNYMIEVMHGVNDADQEKRGAGNAM